MEVVRRIAENVRDKMETMVFYMDSFRAKKSSQLAAAVVFSARKDVLKT